MPRVTIRIGARERINPTISKATLLLPTDALVSIGTTSIAKHRHASPGQRPHQAAELAEAYDADPDGFNQREQAERAANQA